VNNSIFISYRRSVSEFIARAVFQDLRAHAFDVFMDVENIDAGEFDKIIMNQIAARPYLLVILAPGTLDRCSEPGDWLRREIEWAMDLKRTIIPLMTSNFSFEAAKPHLTGKLAELSRYQALSVPHDYFDAAMDRLRTRFLKPVSTPTLAIPDSEQAEVQRKIEQAEAAPLVTERQLNAQDFFERGLIAYFKNERDSAINNFRQAIRLNVTFAEAYCVLGLAYRDSGNVVGAVESFHTALELQGDHPLADTMRSYIASQRDHLYRDFGTGPLRNATPAPSAP